MLCFSAGLGFSCAFTFFTFLENNLFIIVIGAPLLFNKYALIFSLGPRLDMFVREY